MNNKNKKSVNMNTVGYPGPRGFLLILSFFIKKKIFAKKEEKKASGTRVTVGGQI